MATVGIATAAPTNDDFPAAGSEASLVEGIEQRFSTIGATVQATEAYCGAGDPASAGGQTVWFDFVAAEAGDYVAYATGSDHDTEIGWSSSLGISDGTCPDDSRDSFDAVEQARSLTVGEQAYVQVGVNSAGFAGTGGVGVTKVVPAANGFSSPVDLAIRAGASTAVVGLDFTGTQTVETNEPTTCGATTLGTASAWLNFVAVDSGSWMFEAKSADVVDIALYTGNSIGALTLLNCATTDHRAVIADLVAGDTYRLRVSNGALAPRPVVVRAEQAPAPMTAALVDDGGGTSTDVGSSSDLAVVGGLPAIAYHDLTHGELRYAARAGSTWTDSLIDANGGGTSTDVGSAMSMAVLLNGLPAVAYYDFSNGELRYASATRSGSTLTWTDSLIDANGDGSSTDVGSEMSLAVLSSSEPAVAYYDRKKGELRYASSHSGVWGDVLVDEHGDGTSSNVGQGPALVQLWNGDLGISYIDVANNQIRFARGNGVSWSDETVYAAPGGHRLVGTDMKIDRWGNPVVVATDASQGDHILAWWNGSVWNIEHDRADRHLAELDFGCANPRLLIGEDNSVYVPWTDCNYAGTMAISVRNPQGQWSVVDAISRSYQASDAGNFAGTAAVWSTTALGATWLPDGKIALSFQYDDDGSLWYAEDDVTRRPPPVVPDGGGAGGGGAGGGGDGGSGDGSSGTDTTTEAAPGTGNLLGASKLEACRQPADPFVDVPAGSFARADVTCIYNLGVTTGTSPITYSPAAVVTRAQMALFLSRLYKAVTGADAPVVATPFVDVPSTSSAMDAIARIYGLDVTRGASPTTYSPAGVVTRAQMALFLSRFYKAVTGADAPVVATPFVDVSSTSSARDAIARVYGLGVARGTSPTTYSPTAVVTREEMAAFLTRLYEVSWA